MVHGDIDGFSLHRWASLGWSERIDTIGWLVDRWFGPIRATDPDWADRALGGVECPASLRYWYATIGKPHRQLWRGNQVLEPTELVRQDDGSLTFYAENQWVFLFSVPAERGGEPDPEVTCHEARRVDVRGIRVTDLLLQAIIVEAYAQDRAQPTAHGELDLTRLAALDVLVPPLPMGSWNLLDCEFVFRGSADFAGFSQLGRELFVWVAASSPASLDRLRALLSPRPRAAASAR